ncbi:hypothetical protein M3Y96_00101200 [Aphelenchoides besseyi]|nr:hypothetical protein M3Y96_00101200 [Aphelenchoides besseyi]
MQITKITHELHFVRSEADRISRDLGAAMIFTLIAGSAPLLLLLPSVFCIKRQKQGNPQTVAIKTEFKGGFLRCCNGSTQNRRGKSMAKETVVPNPPIPVVDPRSPQPKEEIATPPTNTAKPAIKKEVEKAPEENKLKIEKTVLLTLRDKGKVSEKEKSDVDVDEDLKRSKKDKAGVIDRYFLVDEKKKQLTVKTTQSEENRGK